MKQTACLAQLALAFFLVLPAVSIAVTLPKRSTSSVDVEKRETNKTQIPAPLSIQPSQYWDGNDGAWSSFPLQIGANAAHSQSIRVFASTAGYSIWAVRPGGCPSSYPSSCSGDRGGLYNYNDSLTWVPNSIYDMGVENNLGFSSSAQFGFDTAMLGYSGGTGASNNHSIIGSYDSTTYFVGMFGLKPIPTNFSDFTSPQASYMQILNQTNQIPSTSYGYTAGNPYRLKNAYGSLTLGGYDAARFDNTKNVSMPLGTDVSYDLEIGVQAITTNATSDILTSSSGGFYAQIDSTIPYLYLPLSVCQAFEKAFGLTWDSGTSLYLVNASLHAQLLELNPTVTFTLGPQIDSTEKIDIVFPYSAFDLKVSYPITAINDPSLYFPLKQAANSTQYTLGRTFLQEAYLIVDYERRNFTVAPCVWNANTLQSQVRTILLPGLTISQDEQSSSLTSGAKAGIAVGAVAAVSALLLILLFLRRKRAARKRKLSLSTATAATVAEKDSNVTSPPIYHPLSGELDGSQPNIPELETPKFKATELDSPHKMDPNRAGYTEMEGEGDVEYFSKMPRHGANEMEGSSPAHEMDANHVYELPASVPGREEGYDSDRAKR